MKSPKPQNKTAFKTLGKKISQLRTQIRDHDYHYYILGKPKISDFAYDQLFLKLLELEKRHPDLITPTSPSQKVGGGVISGFEKQNHSLPMLSLQNTYNEEDLLSFIEKIKKNLEPEKPEFFLEPKFDGVAIELNYQNGELVSALTRGDGLVGENVFPNVKTVRNIPLQLLSKPERLEIRGELILLKKDFQKMNKELMNQNKAHFSNPRNMVAGTLRQLNSHVVALRPLHFFAHSLAVFSETGGLLTQSQFYQAVRKWGIPTLPVWSFPLFQKNKRQFKNNVACMTCTEYSQIKEYLKTLEDIRHSLDFEIDGVVIKVNNFEQQSRIGQTSRHPKWANAYKFKAHFGVTRVEKIEVQVGRTGILTPVAHFVPVQVGGVIIKKASLHNFTELKRKDVRAGDEVTIERAGDVIPEVIKVHAEKRKKPSVRFKNPIRCPGCEARVLLEGDALFCSNLLCPAVRLRSLMHFVSKKGVNIEFLGPKLLEKLYNNQLVTTFVDIYLLNREKIMPLPRMAEKSCSGLLQNIEKSKTGTSLSRFIYALGIRHIGEQNAKQISLHFSKKSPSPKSLPLASPVTHMEKPSASQVKHSKSISKTPSPEQKTLAHPASFLLKEDLSNWPKPLVLLVTASFEELSSIPDLGEISSRYIIQAFSNKQLIKDLTKLFHLGFKIKPEPFLDHRDKLPLNGKQFVITGTLPLSREQIKQNIIQAGGTVQNTITKKTHFLLSAEEPSDNNKLSKKSLAAKKLGVKVLNWEDFQDLMMFKDKDN